MEFAQIVDAAIEQNRKRRVEFSDYAKHCRAPEFVAEFCTVRVDIGRAAGKTTYIAEHARPWDAVVLPNQHMVDQYLHMARAGYDNVFSAGEFGDIPAMPRRLLGRRWVPRTIYVDEASRIDIKRMGAIYFALASHPDQTFVLLG